MGIELIQNGNQFVLHTRTADFAMEACHHFQNNMVLQLTGQPVDGKSIPSCLHSVKKMYNSYYAPKMP